MPWEDDDGFLLPETVRAIPVRIACLCSRAPRARNIHVSEEAILWVKRQPEPPPPGMVWQSFRCHKCKAVVKVTSRMLYFAA
jgi:hypothetical protein